LRESSDLITALALTLTFTVIVTNFPDWENIIRAGFGAVVMLLIPGYLLTLVLFPTNDGIDVAERTALTLALSAITIIAMGLVLNYLPVGIQAGSIAISLTVTNTALTVLGGLQRGRLEPSRRFLLPPALGVRRLLMGMTGFVVVIILFNTAIPQDRFTEFYLLGPSGQLDNYPRYLQPGETFGMRVGITNLEGHPQTYRIRLPAGEIRDEDIFIEVPQLQHEETWETPLTLQAPRELGSEQLVFDLLKDDTLATYRQLTFTINVDPERREQRPPPTASTDITATSSTPTSIPTSIPVIPALTTPALTPPTPTDTAATVFWSQLLNRPSVISLRQALEPTSPILLPPFTPSPISSSSSVRVTNQLEDTRATY
jgi:uncharacterized membrane protein